MKRYRAIADYYDAEYAHAEMLARDVPFFLQHLPRGRQQVLELAVGTARAAIPIAQAGHRVLGVDAAADMLAIAQRKRDSVGLRPADLTLRRGDVLQLRLSRRFDWVCLFFNTFLNFTTLEAQDRLLGVVRRHLKKNGHFWLDIFQPNLALLAREHSMDLDPKVFYVPHLDRTVFCSTEIRRDPSQQLQRVTFHYRWFDAAGTEHSQKREFDLTFVFPRELQLLLERNGLRLRKLYGDYDGSDLSADSPRMIAWCHRASKPMFR